MKQTSPAQTSPAKSSQSGFSLVEALFALTIAAVVMIPVTRWITQSGRDVVAQNAAGQLRQVGEAGRRYVQDNYSTVVAAVGSGPVSITLCQLQGLNSDCSTPGTSLPAYLPTSMNQANPYGHTYALRVRSAGTYTDPVSGAIGTRLEAAVVTEIPATGRVVPESDIAYVAGLAGGGAGYTTSASPGTITGHSSSYTTTLAPLGATSGAGRLAWMAFFGDGDTVDDRLNRFQIPSRPEANRMHTAIDMNSNDIAGGRNLTFDGTVRLADPGNTMTSVVASWGTNYSSRSVRIGGDGTTTSGLNVAGGIYTQAEINTEDRLGARLTVNSGCIPSDPVSECSQLDRGNILNNVAGIRRTGEIYNAGIEVSSSGYITSSDGASFTQPVYSPNFYYTSDIRAKQDLEPLTDALQRIERLGGYSFTWKRDGKRDIGLVAQQVAEQFPELISVHPVTGMLTVAYPNMVAPLIEAVKTLGRRNDELSRTVEQLAAERAAEQGKEPKP